MFSCCFWVCRFVDVEFSGWFCSFVVSVEDLVVAFSGLMV